MKRGWRDIVRDLPLMLALYLLAVSGLLIPFLNEIFSHKKKKHFAYRRLSQFVISVSSKTIWTEEVNSQLLRYEGRFFLHNSGPHLQPFPLLILGKQMQVRQQENLAHQQVCCGFVMQFITNHTSSFLCHLRLHSVLPFPPRMVVHHVVL